MGWSLIIIVLIITIISFSNSTILKKYNSSQTIYQVNTPPYALGNLDFPVNGIPIFREGCRGVRDLEESETISTSNADSKNRSIIVFIGYDATDDSCFWSDHIFECGKKSWCSGVVTEDPFYSPTGANMWSLFDKVRERSEYLVPLVQITTEDFQMLRATIKENWSDYEVVLTKDPNPWEAMFKSLSFFIIFRVFLPLSSFGCVILIIVVWRKKNHPSIANDPKNKNPLSSFSLKNVCLLLNLVTQIARIGTSFDPLLSSQIYPYLISMIVLNSSIAFEISSSVLLSFVVRELTQASHTLQTISRIKRLFLVISLYMAISFTLVTIEGLKKNIFPFRILYISGAFYAFVDIGFGLWYLWQGFQFLKMVRQNEKVVKKQNKTRIALARLSIYNSIGMILFGMGFSLIAVRPVYGSPWGYHSFWCVSFFIAQSISVCEIFLFGGVRVHKRRMTNLRHSSRKLDSNSDKLFGELSSKEKSK